MSSGPHQYIIDCDVPLWDIVWSFIHGHVLKNILTLKRDGQTENIAMSLTPLCGQMNVHALTFQIENKITQE